MAVAESVSPREAGTCQSQASWGGGRRGTGAAATAWPEVSAGATTMGLPSYSTLTILACLSPLNRDSSQYRVHRVWGGCASVHTMRYLAMVTAVHHNPTMGAYGRLCRRGKSRQGMPDPQNGYRTVTRIWCDWALPGSWMVSNPDCLSIISGLPRQKRVGLSQGRFINAVGVNHPACLEDCEAGSTGDG